MKKIRGFTLMEILLVMGIMAILVGLTAAISARSIRNSEFDRVRDTIRSEIAAAQADTIAGTLDSSWGVALFTNSITRYRGSSFAARDTVFDLTTNFENEVVISGTTDVAFTRPYGAPLTSAQVVITDGVRHSTTTINVLGTIEVE